MTPRLKYSEQRSPMLATAQRADSKKAASLIEYDDMQEFMINRNNKNDLSNGMD
jgi:hypothetical protein